MFLAGEFSCFFWAAAIFFLTPADLLATDSYPVTEYGDSRKRANLLCPPPPCAFNARYGRNPVAAVPLPGSLTAASGSPSTITSLSISAGRTGSSLPQWWIGTRSKRRSLEWCGSGINQRRRTNCWRIGMPPASAWLCCQGVIQAQGKLATGCDRVLPLLRVLFR